jgi:hypothetical protein
METRNILKPYRFVKDRSAAEFLGEDAAGPDFSD